jgi:hypothetical protein
VPEAQPSPNKDTTDEATRNFDAIGAHQRALENRQAFARVMLLLHE